MLHAVLRCAALCTFPPLFSLRISQLFSLPHRAENSREGPKGRRFVQGSDPPAFRTYPRNEPVGVRGGGLAVGALCPCMPHRACSICAPPAALIVCAAPRLVCDSPQEDQAQQEMSAWAESHAARQAELLANLPAERLHPATGEPRPCVCGICERCQGGQPSMRQVRWPAVWQGWGMAGHVAELHWQGRCWRGLPTPPPTPPADCGGHGVRLGCAVDDCGGGGGAQG